MYTIYKIYIYIYIYTIMGHSDWSWLCGACADVNPRAALLERGLGETLHDLDVHIDARRLHCILQTDP
jgi:hypothetical protein